MNQTNVTPTSTQQTEALAEVIKLGIDIHRKHYVVVRQIDNAPGWVHESHERDRLDGRKDSAAAAPPP